MSQDDDLLTSTEVALKFGVHVSSVKRWDTQGKLTADFRTPTGQRRYRGTRVDALLKASEERGLVRGRVVASGREG